MVTLLRATEDLDWLFEVHLKDMLNLRQRTFAAILYGNEDSPESVQLYGQDNYKSNFKTITF
jgi:hypothetical protein